MLLSDLKVVEWSTWVAGPGCAAVMADWGAQVVKIESEIGDATRTFWPDTAESPGNPIFAQQIDAARSLLHLSPDAALAFFNASVDSQAAVMGLNDIFYVSAIIFVAIIPLIWITKPSRAGGGDTDAAAAGAH